MKIEKNLLQKTIDMINKLISEVEYYEGELSVHLCNEDNKNRQDEFDGTELVIQEGYELIDKLKNLSE